jgi:PAS domain S-box-containing protein
VIVIDFDKGRRTIADVNTATETIFGYSRDELIGRTTRILHVDDDSFREFGEAANASLDEAGVYQARFPLRRKDGSIFEAEQTVTLLKPGVGLRAGGVSVVRDVSGRAELERKLRQSQKMEAIGRLAGGIAHDFNNLLTIISVQTEMMRDRIGQDPELEDDLELVEDATRRGGDLTGQLLALAREQDLQPRPVVLSAVVESMGRMLDRIIGDDVRLDLDLERDEPPVELDPGQLEQIIMNLAINARDAMPDGGVLRFSVRQESASPGPARNAAEAEAGDHIVMEVSDTGAGIDENTIDRIFEPFFSTKTPGAGTGLGLATVYAVVQQSGGSIEVTSQVGEGSTFRIRFPVAGELGDDAESGTKEVLDQERGLHILLVEDDDVVRGVTARMLEKAGHHVGSCGDAEEALETLRQGPVPDVIVTDLMLPGMSGPELVENIREVHPGMPIVTTSGFSEGPGRERLPANVVFVPKPFARQDLLRAIREVGWRPAPATDENS